MTAAHHDWTANLPRKRVSAGVLFTAPDGRILVVEPTYKPEWEIPGGAVEADESPYQGAVRECLEELGLTIAPARLLVVDWAEPHPDRTESLAFVFEGVLDADEIARIRLPADELRSWAWCVPAEFYLRVKPSMARRVASAIEARDAGDTRYLDAGRPPA